jgi:large repetitive protein
MAKRCTLQLVSPDEVAPECTDGQGPLGPDGFCVCHPDGGLRVPVGGRNVSVRRARSPSVLVNFTVSSDGHGGTSLVDPPIPTGQSGESALNQQVALLSQHMASAFPSSALSNGSPSAVDPSELGGGQLSQLAQSVANQQHFS